MRKLSLLLLCVPLWGHGAPREILLVEPKEITGKTLAEKFHAVALLLNEETANQAANAAKRIMGAKRDMYYWIEVARNPLMAEAHPEWMGSIGMHNDWRGRFPDSRLPGNSDVTKAFPWVPITGKAAFDAHLKRITTLLDKAPKEFRGLIINDLQGPPSSCGCGNLQCRWAVDYHVPATAEQLPQDDAAARFIASVRKLVWGKEVIPVWTTECEDQDLPPKHRQGRETTGYCGDVGCAIGLCPKEFAKQWNRVTEKAGPIALLSLHREFQRTGPEWISQVLSYVETIGANNIARSNLWLVVEGKDEKEERAARELAARSGVGATVIARVQIDQSYSPRLMAVK